ncbi:phage portal protein [Albibacterium profundi]|uniref:Phage portal protein n=1 Tax=Albibacterium profundi TaxID=3134906 RepID=A0ABV5CEZ3_9SPHI
MKKIEEIIDSSRDIKDIINDLKKKTIKVPEWDELEKVYEPKLHKIMDPAVFKDKEVKDDKGNVVRTEPVTRVAIGLQKLSVKRIAEFMFTIPVNTILEDDETLQKEQFKSIIKIQKKNRWDVLNKKRCKITSSECECAVHWYLVENKNKSYGFQSNYKLKYAIYSPKNGDKLYPLFDETRDMIAFSREINMNSTNDEGLKVNVTVFETWTADRHIRWRKEGANDWELVLNEENKIGKIPIIYTYRPEPIWDDADNGKVHEIELLLSRNGEIIAYHASPVLIIKGKLKGAPTKGEGNKVFFTEDGTGGAEYASWQQSPESVRFQFETLLRLFFTELQLPDLSFENIKGIGAQSGESRKWMLVDAHLKVGDESEIYLDSLEREYNIIKAFLGLMNPKWKGTVGDLELTPEIRPFTVEDEKGRVEVLVAANGNKPIISQQQAVKQAGLVDDPDEDWVQIQAEYTKENTFNVFEPTE